MGIGAAVFESVGQRTEHWVPGAYSRSSSVSSGSGGITAGNLVVLGCSMGGKPRTLYEFGSIAEAKEVLLSGDLLNGVAHAFTPSSDYSPQKVFAMRVDNGTQSQRILKCGETEVCTLKAWDWGPHTNQLKMKIEKKSDEKLKVSTIYKDSKFESDDIELASFSLKYKGPGSFTKFTISKTHLVTEISGEGTSNSLNISLEGLESLSELESKILDYPCYTMKILDKFPNPKISELDHGVTSEIEDGEMIWYSNFYALINCLKNNPLIGSVELPSEANRINQLPDIDDTYVYFSKGELDDTTITSWKDTLNILSTENIQIIVTPSVKPDVHNAIKLHCIEMSNTQNRKERTCILGGDIDQEMDDAITTAKEIGSKLCSYVYPSIVATNPLTGSAESLPASYLACKLGGLESAVAVNEPLTWKTLSVLSFSKKLKISEMNKCIQGGLICCGTTDDNRLAVIRAMTTFQGNNLQDCERSMVREDLFMNRDLRERFSRGIGRPDPTGGNSSTDEEVLKIAAKDWRGQGLIIPDDGGNLYWGLSIRKNGDKTYITFNRYLTPPRNFVFITANNFIYGSSSTTVEA